MLYGFLDACYGPEKSPYYATAELYTKQRHKSPDMPIYAL